MKNAIVIVSALSLSACTAHVGYNDIGAALRSFSAPQAYGTQQASAKDCVFYATKRAAKKAESDLLSTQDILSIAQRKLSFNPAWDGQQCRQPAQKPLPAEPKGLSAQEAEFQAIGGCVDLLTRRHNSNKVMQSMIAVRQESLWEIFEQWKKAKQESCAFSYMPSQTQDFVARLCGGLGQEASNSCLMDYLSMCRTETRQACHAEHDSWKQRVAEIKAEPQKLVQECHTSLEQIAHAEQALPKLQMTAQLNWEEHQKIKQPRVPERACR